MTAPGDGELIVENGCASFGVGTVEVEVEICYVCQTPFTVPTPESHVHNLKLRFTERAVRWCEIR